MILTPEEMKADCIERYDRKRESNFLLRISPQNAKAFGRIKKSEL